MAAEKMNLPAELYLKTKAAFPCAAAPEKSSPVRDFLSV
jgi:hypothetical protein